VGNNIKPPRMLAIIAVILIAIGLASMPIIQGLSKEVLTTSVLLNGIPFLTIFVAIVLLFIYSIFVVASKLTGNISPRIYSVIEAIIIGGIVFGVIGMFQSVAIGAYQIGFLLLLFSMLAFNVWSHVVPRNESSDEKAKLAATDSPHG
jgi:hypothetical protein